MRDRLVLVSLTVCSLFAVLCFCRTGSWRSVYTLNTSSGGSADVKGTVKLGVHYFEDGNVQLHTNVEHQGKVSLAVSRDASHTTAAGSAAQAIEAPWLSLILRPLLLFVLRVQSPEATASELRKQIESFETGFQVGPRCFAQIRRA